MYKQTLCFIRRNDEILMLNRENEPTQGLWNGVGGKMESEETPMESVIREVKEETNIDIRTYNLINKGIITWEVDNSYVGGLYVYLVEIEDDYDYQTPKGIDEGILDWKKITWLLEDKNLGVGEMLPHFLPNILYKDKKYNHFCVLRNMRLIDYKISEID